MSKIPRFIALFDVLAMLDECAADHTRRRTRHGVIVKWGGDSFLLPKGKHGRIDTAEIGTSKVRTMVSQHGIPGECAGKMLPSLAGCF